jgi:signal transduction histidine kinase
MKDRDHNSHPKRAAQRRAERVAPALTAERERLIERQAEHRAYRHLAAAVAHELNTPLQAVQNYLYLLMNEQHRTDETLDSIHAELDRMDQIVSRLRESSGEVLAREVSGPVAAILKLDTATDDPVKPGKRHSDPDR